MSPTTRPRVAAVALPHDWLTWRLRGYGPADESQLGPDLNALVTDRSDASGTAYFNANTNEYDLDLLEAGLGRSDIILPSACSRQPSRRDAPRTACGRRARERATTPQPRSGSARDPATWSSRSARAAPCSR